MMDDALDKDQLEDMGNMQMQIKQFEMSASNSRSMRPVTEQIDSSSLPKFDRISEMIGGSKGASVIQPVDDSQLEGLQRQSTYIKRTREVDDIYDFKFN